MGLFGPSKKEKALQAEVERLTGLLLPEQRDIENLNQQISSLKLTIAGLEKTINNNNDKIGVLNTQVSKLDHEILEKRKQLAVFEVDINALDYGLYKPTFEFANSDLYKEELSKLRDKQKQCIKNDNAAYGNTNWQVNGSAAQGRSMVNNYKKLLLRAFNVECDDIVANVKVSNLDRSIERIEKISEQISKLGKTMAIGISPGYVRLKIDEVKLALDYQQKKQEEKERQKELRAQEREEAKVLKEIEEERKRLKKEQTHYENALKTVLTQIEKNGETDELLEKKLQLESQINDTAKAIEDVDYREANRKAGYVYIISNIGAFGENVYKIGMTRRLDPQERVDELSDASVPFNFDIHAMIFTEDAPGLETALHNAFQSKKLNKINTRREFFAVSLDEIKAEVRKNFDKTVEWIDIPEAEQYRQSKLLNKF
jgi:septal ring factor EnvC (AmiA/AmiB activator)